MLITQLKKKEDILPFLKAKTLLVACFGCKEVYFPEKEYKNIKEELKTLYPGLSGEIILDYLCNEDYTGKRLELYRQELEKAETIVVFACGVGVQTLAGLLASKTVLAGCDTYYLPGFSGFTPSSYDCEQCGECRLSSTAGICPVTACSKGLLNGPCGGAKNGKCEVSKIKECGWENIMNKITTTGKVAGKLKESVSIRDYKKSQ